MWPRIVAEALRRVAIPSAAAARRHTRGSSAIALDMLRAAMEPSRSSSSPPPFLLPHQHDSWRRVTSALDQWCGALLLDDVGTGKTWVALAVAADQRGPVVAIVPAILRHQWQAAAGRAGVALNLWTHERMSRGRVPPVDPSLVIVDEAHRFRSVASQRTRTLAPWLVGRRTLLLTATPIVNRVDDLLALLRIALPEDALRLDGIAQLGELVALASPPAALRRVAVRTPSQSEVFASRRSVILDIDDAERGRGERAVADITSLELSESAPIRRLLLSVLLDAAGSSDAALHQALRRYRALLLQSRDAGGASRQMLRQFAGESLEQLVFWPLLDAPPAPGELPLADIARVEALLATPPDDDPWIRQLQRQIDDRPCACFTRHRATARALRIALGERTAWVTGADAGIGPHHLPRQIVLDAFGARRAEWNARRHAPRLLVATDVAAEGLDLQAAGCIIHVDVPWTAMRLQQREGRLLRLGQAHPTVDVVVRTAAPAIEAALAPLARVRRKQSLAERWNHALETGMSPAPAVDSPVVASVDSPEPGALIAVRMIHGSRSGLMLMTSGSEGEWRCDPVATAHWVARARGGSDLPCEARGDGTPELAAATREALTSCQRPGDGSRALVERIHVLARRAASLRDGPMLQRLDRLLRFAAASPTLGARIMQAELLHLPDRALLAARVPDLPEEAPIQAIPIVAILFRSPCVPLR